MSIKRLPLRFLSLYLSLCLSADPALAATSFTGGPFLQGKPARLCVTMRFAEEAISAVLVDESHPILKKYPSIVKIARYFRILKPLATAAPVSELPDAVLRSANLIYQFPAEYWNHFMLRKDWREFIQEIRNTDPESARQFEELGPVIYTSGTGELVRYKTRNIGIALMGPSGAGKSLTAALLTGRRFFRWTRADSSSDFEYIGGEPIIFLTIHGHVLAGPQVPLPQATIPDVLLPRFFEAKKSSTKIAHRRRLIPLDGIICLLPPEDQALRSDARRFLMNTILSTSVFPEELFSLPHHDINVPAPPSTRRQALKVVEEVRQWSRSLSLAKPNRSNSLSSITETDATGAPHKLDVHISRGA